MRILIVSCVELVDTNSSGNTIMNWFGEWDSAEIANVYCREADPDNSYCTKYLRITALNVLKNVLSRSRIGKAFTKSDVSRSDSGALNRNLESRLISSSKNKSRWMLYYLNDWLFLSRIWQNKRYKSFIEGFAPDVVFYFVKSEAFIFENLKYLKKHSRAKFVGFIADDMDTIYGEGKGLLSKIFRKRFHKIIGMSDQLFGASKLLCETYKNKFSYNITPLYKGCDISRPKNTVNDPIRIVYAGNLLFGRAQVLGKLAETILELNADKQTFLLEIYTGSEITNELDKSLNVTGISRIMGRRSHDEIKSIMKSADIVLHVESFNPYFNKIVGLSYSTKITDCLQSGSMMMVIGPPTVASVVESMNIDGALVVTDEATLPGTLKSIMEDRAIILRRAAETNEFAGNKFPIGKIRSNFRNEIVKLTEKK